MSGGCELRATTIEAVVFDIGRVIVEWDLRLIFGKLIENREELDWFCSTVVTEQWHAQTDAGRPPGDMVAERAREYPEYAAVIAAYADRFEESIPGYVAGVPELIERLAARNVPLYAITNFGAEFWARFRPRHALFSHFRDVVVSGEERLIKPDPAIFAIAEKRFGHPASTMLFIDDNGGNITAASRCGWQVHHFVGGAAELEQDFCHRGLLESAIA